MKISFLDFEFMSLLLNLIAFISIETEALLLTLAKPILQNFIWICGGGSNSSSHGTGTVFCCLLARLPFQMFMYPLTLLVLLDTGLL